MLKITIYSTPTCSKCRMIKDYLTSQEIEFTDLDAVEHYEDVKDTWFMSAPIIKVEEENEPNIWFEEIEDFIAYINDNANKD